MSAWRWVGTASALAAHREQLAIYGGGDGVRDVGLLESALARPQHLASYGNPDAAELAASYAFGIARNHPFVDGNKRVALLVCEAFLVKNGFALAATNSELVPVFLDLAAGNLREEELAEWLRERIQAA
jgi:death-on-curing protein